MARKFGSEEYRLLHEQGKFSKGRHLIVTHVLNAGEDHNFIVGHLVDKETGSTVRGHFRCASEYAESIRDIRTWRTRLTLARKEKMAKAQAVKKIKQEYKEQEDGFNSHLNEIKLILAKRAMHALELPKGVEIKPGQLLSEKPVKARELTPDELRQIAKKYAEAIDTIAI